MNDEVIRRICGEREAIPVSPEPQKVGVYFLLWKGEVVYVGQSVNVDARVSLHRDEKRKRFDSAVFIPFREQELDYYESAFMNAIRPKYNKTYPHDGAAGVPVFKRSQDDECAAAVVGFLTHTDEDGITFDEIISRLRDNGYQWSRPSISRSLDANPHLTWCAEDMKYRLATTPCT